MARMKIEVSSARASKLGISLHDRIVGWLPRYARFAAAVPFLLNARERVPGAARMMEKILRFSARRSLPPWRKDWFRDPAAPTGALSGRGVVLFADTFNRYFEPENLAAAIAVLRAANYHVHVARPANGGTRPLCCGRTFLAIGRVDEARCEAERALAALMPFATRG